MSDEKRAQVKRAILAELNKELTRKTRTLSKARGVADKPPGVVSKDKSRDPRHDDLLPSSSSAKLHKPKRTKSKFDAQKYAESVPLKPIHVEGETGTSKLSSRSKKNVFIPQPTPRIEHPPSSHEITNPIVRKYADIWIKRVFSDDREAHSKARDFHRRKLGLKYFSVWRKESYSKQTEWKLIVRADCHYRFYLKEKTWESWRKFLVENKTASQNKLLADQACSKILQRRYLHLLKQAVKVRKEVNANNSVALSVYNRNLAAKMLRQWHFALAERNIAHQQENIALHFWSLSLQRQCLEKWIMYKNEQILKKKMTVVVSNFYDGKLLQQSFRTWVAYRQQRKCKMIEQRKAEKLYKSKMQHKYFYQWSDQAVISAKTRHLEGEIHLIWYKFRCRRMLLQWREFCDLQNEKRELLKLSEGHARKKLLQKVMNNLKFYTQHQQQTLVNKNTAEAFRRKNILSSCFKKWTTKLDQVEEDKLKYRTLMARKHHQLKLLRSALQQWVAYKEYRSDVKECYTLADSHYNTTVTQHMFTYWHLYFCYRKTLQVKKDTAELHYSELLNHKYFYTWLKMYHVSQNQRQDERIAVLHCSKVLIVKHFSLWRDRGVEHAAIKSKEEVAIQHHQSKLLSRGLSAFVRNKHHVFDKALFKQRATEHHNRKQLVKCFNVLNVNREYQQVKRGKRMIADAHYNNKLKSEKLTCWIAHHRVMSKAKSVLQDVKSEYEKKLISKVLARWISQAKLQKQAADLNVRAVLHYRETLLRKVVSGWLAHTEQRARDHVVKLELLAEGELMLQTLRMKQVFRKWKARTVEEMRYRELCEVADQHHCERMKRKVFVGFGQNVELQFKKMLLGRKLDNFVSDHVVKKMFTRWKDVHKEREVEKNQTERALWFWCVTLEHRTLRAWINYTQYRKKKRRAYSAALQDRRKYLIQTGLREWIKSVTVAEDTRSRAVLLAVTQQTYRANELALKWGRHWRNIVKTRTARKPARNELGSGDKENRRTVKTKSYLVNSVRSNFVETPKFYESFKSLKSSRPAPKIPKFLV